jgi:hypothetical protein
MKSCRKRSFSNEQNETRYVSDFSSKCELRASIQYYWSIVRSSKIVQFDYLFRNDDDTISWLKEEFISEIRCRFCNWRKDDQRRSQQENEKANERVTNRLQRALHQRWWRRRRQFSKYEHSKINSDTLFNCIYYFVFQRLIIYRKRKNEVLMLKNSFLRNKTN